MPGIPLDKAELLALTLEAIVYGVFASSFVGTMWMFVARRGTKKQYPMIAVMCAMFLGATVHLIIDIIRAFEAFIDNPNGATLYYANLSNPKHIAKTMVFVFQAAFGDGFFIYRVWVVWRHQLLPVVLPILCLTGNFIAGCGVVYELINIDPGAAIFASTLIPWITSFFCMTLATNIMCTLLIAGRIYYLSRQVNFWHNGLGAGTSPALGIVLESGSVISAAILSLLIVYLHGSNGQYPALDILTPLIGVVFCMIIIRVSMGYALAESGPSRSTGPLSSRWSSRPGLPSNIGDLTYLGPGSMNMSASTQQDDQDMDAPYDVYGGRYRKAGAS